MYKYILESASSIDWMALGPLVLFFTFFVATTIITYRTDKSHIKKMAQMPLDQDS